MPPGFMNATTGSSPPGVTMGAKTFCASAIRLPSGESPPFASAVRLIVVPSVATPAEIESAVRRVQRYAVGVSGHAELLGAFAIEPGVVGVAYAVGDARLLDESIAAGSPLDGAELAAGIERALRPLHDQGMAHGGLRPELIGRASDGRVLVLGFDPLVLDAPAALLLTLTAALMLAFGTILMRGMRGVNTFQMQAWMALIGIPFLLVVSYAIEPPAAPIIVSTNTLGGSLPASASLASAYSPSMPVT